MLSKTDLLERDLDSESMYGNFYRIIERVNSISAMDLVGHLLSSPRKGNSPSGQGRGLGLTLTQLDRAALETGVQLGKAHKSLWGN